MSTVFLVGFMGAGKSTVGRLVAQELDVPFLDLDADIERRVGMSVAAIFDAEGEPVFRELEREALARVTAGPECVVACGGGIVIDERNRDLMRASGRVVYLHVTASAALSRVEGGSARPLLRGRTPEETATLLAARELLYEDVAHLTVDTVGRDAESVAGDVVRALSEAGAVS